MGVRYTLAQLYEKGFDVNIQDGHAKKKSKYGNHKVDNNGKKMDSKLEKHFFNLLSINKIRFKSQAAYILQDKFTYMGEAIRSCKIIVDFCILKGDSIIAIVDTKGFQTEKNKLQVKLLKKAMYPQIPIFLPKNKAECESVVVKLLDITKNE